jgi:fructose-bisphosphate aldolase class II
MSLITLKQGLDMAEAGNYALGMFNIISLEYAEAVVRAAERVNLPVILGFPEAFFKYHDVEMMGPLLVRFAERSTVPCVVHIDHGVDYNLLMKSLKYGFTSIMFDGSALPHQENIDQTREIVKAAHAFGASVEGEIGYLGFGEGADEDPNAATSLDRVNQLHLTNPEEARSFAEVTGVDALAIAIGNMHGHYRGEPKLDFERLQAIHKATPCALVLHGGSGISDADFVRAIRGGIRKVNIYTAMNDNALQFLRDHLGDGMPWVDLACKQRDAIEDQVADFVRLFGCIGR